ncbi:DUF3761 domain-containing protein [Acinetobacter baumannii]|uniref:DUF3761 domain-containing protein n=1 Tax=Acinetobacter baumannii TaxID=470 RepID=UPI001D185DE7|nr:DUF3761 domain-containing protein [Acinetobacter baumannii]
MLSLSGCISLQKEPISYPIEKIYPIEQYEEQNQNLHTNADDSISKLVQELPEPAPQLEVKIVGYVNTDVLEVFPSPKKLKAINHVTRGTKIFVFDTKGDWANISADVEYPYWVNLASICFTDKCWVKKNTYTSDPSIDTQSKGLVTLREKKTTHPTVNNQSKIKTTSYSGKGYTNVYGNYVPSPRKSNKPPAGATAKCRDGTWSFSQSSRGTCSHHGGVATWLY